MHLPWASYENTVWAAGFPGLQIKDYASPNFSRFTISLKVYKAFAPLNSWDLSTSDKVSPVDRGGPTAGSFSYYIDWYDIWQPPFTKTVKSGITEITINNVIKKRSYNFRQAQCCPQRHGKPYSRYRFRRRCKCWRWWKYRIFIDQWGLSTKIPWKVLTITFVCSRRQWINVSMRGNENLKSHYKDEISLRW